jgi:hypothetical protein
VDYAKALSGKLINFVRIDPVVYGDYNSFMAFSMFWVAFVRLTIQVA